ncbi:MAG: helix-turn-helix domain-containing protein [Candidatus Methanomethylophilaceae archaeon]|jgi:DNA-binding HxlR family transcriptional regulator|nr:helix-turn-helix domain-containing protein [Candidatus Methanomethylophilaceae archaeon]
MDCAIDATMSVIEGRWKSVILCKLAVKGRMRFSHLMKELDGISPRMLTKQLREMEEDRLVIREVYPEVPVRVEYSLAPRGQSLMPALRALADWGLRNMLPNRVAFEESVEIPDRRAEDLSGRAPY